VQAENKRKRVSGTIVKMPNITDGMQAVREIVNLDAEKAVIGAVLREPSVYASVSEVLQPADFHELRHGYIWHAYDRITARSEEIDLITVADELDVLKQYTEDTPLWLARLAGSADRVESVEAYARIVRDSATRLRMIAAADEIKQTALDRAKFNSIDSAVDEANRLLFEATDQQIQRDDTSMISVIGAYMEQVEQARSGQLVRGISYGYANVDDLLKAAVPGEITVIAGGEGMGKTTFCLGGVRSLAKRGAKVVVFTLEMMQQEIAQIFISMETGIAKRALKVYDLTDAQWSEFVRASGVVGNWGVHIIDEFPTLTPLQTRRRLRTLIQAQGVGVDLIVIDGLWLMEYVDANGALEQDRPKAVGNILRDLVQIGRDFNVPIWITHQYNGQAWARQNKRPVLHDLAESAGVRRNAQVIIGLYRDSYYGVDDASDMTEAHVLKDRNGSGAQGQSVEFKFDATHNLFLPITREHDGRPF
jgi:replicative DNA helicase